MLICIHFLNFVCKFYIFGIILRKNILWHLLGMYASSLYQLFYCFVIIRCCLLHYHILTKLLRIWDLLWKEQKVTSKCCSVFLEKEMLAFRAENFQSASPLCKQCGIPLDNSRRDCKGSYQRASRFSQCPNVSSGLWNCFWVWIPLTLIYYYQLRIKLKHSQKTQVASLPQAEAQEWRTVNQGERSCSNYLLPLPKQDEDIVYLQGLTLHKVPWLETRMALKIPKPSQLLKLKPEMVSPSLPQINCLSL